MKKVFGVDVFTAVIAVIILSLIAYHLVQYFKFKDALSAAIAHTKEAMTIPHLTIYDGQALCERIAKLEKEPQPCTFVEGVR